MTKKLRKMLGDINSPATVALRLLIDTQNKSVITRWCAEYALKVVLPIYEKQVPGDNSPRRILQAAIACADGKIKFADVKSLRAAEWIKPPELETNPIAMAAARAIIDTSCMVWQTPTHSLGFFFYAAAAVAYDRAGLNASDDIYAEIAEEVCRDYTDALRAAAIENEPNPVKLKWNC